MHAKWIAIVLNAGALLVSAQAHAAVEVVQSLEAHPTGKVDVDIGYGSVRVIGWEQSVVEVKGSLGDRVQELEFRRGDRKIWVKVHAPKQGDQCQADLVLRVPRDCDVDVEAVKGPITVSGVRGAMELATLAGAVSVAGPCGRVRAQTVDGNVTVESPQSVTEITTVGGTVTITNAQGQSPVKVETSSGGVTLTGGTFRDVSVRTVSGPIHFEGALTPYGKLRLDTHDGEILAVLPSDLSAEFDVQSHLGSVDNAFAPAARRDVVPDAGVEQDFVVGPAAMQTKINIDTFKGPIQLVKGVASGE